MNGSNTNWWFLPWLFLKTAFLHFKVTFSIFIFITCLNTNAHKCFKRRISFSILNTNHVCLVICFIQYSFCCTWWQLVLSLDSYIQWFGLCIGFSYKTKSKVVLLCVSLCYDVKSIKDSVLILNGHKLMCHSTIKDLFVDNACYFLKITWLFYNTLWCVL